MWMRTRTRIDRLPRRPTVPATFVLIGVWVGLGIGCAKPPSHPDPVPVVAIDLEPRCERTIDGLPALEDGMEAVDSSTEPEHALTTNGTLPFEGRWFIDRGSGSALATLRWGFPTTPESSVSVLDSKLVLAAALLQAAETAANPAGFRNRVLALGGRLRARAEEDWLWLELRFPEARRDEAIELLLEWRDAKHVDRPALERIRRRLALARRAEESAPDAIAREVFRRIHPPPPGASRSRRRQSERSNWTSAQIASFLGSTLRPDASVVVYSGSLDALEAEPVRQRFESEFMKIAAMERPDSTLPPSQPRLRATPPRPASESTAKSIDPSAPDIRIVDRPGAVQVEILVGHPTVAPRDEDFPALEALASLLGGNVGGRLFRDLRERQGLAYLINAEQSDEGRFVVTTRARSERVIALLRGIEDHLRALVETPLKPCETGMLKNRMPGEEALLADDPAARGARIRRDIVLLGEPRSRSRAARLHLEAIEGGLESVARRQLAGRPDIVLVGDAGWLEHDLSKAFPERGLQILNERLEAIRFVAPSRGASSEAK